MAQSTQNEISARKLLKSMILYMFKVSFKDTEMLHNPSTLVPKAGACGAMCRDTMMTYRAQSTCMLGNQQHESVRPEQWQ